MTDLAVTEQPSEHGKRARGENIVDEWFLPVKRFRRGAARQRIFTDTQRRRSAARLLARFSGWPSTNWPLLALLPRSSQ
jgi:hypothetical protein